MSHLILHFQLFSPQGGKKKKTWWPHKHQVAQISYLERNMTLHCVHLWHDIYLPTWSNYCIYTTMEWAWVVGSFGVGRWLWRQILFQIIRRVVRSTPFSFSLDPWYQFQRRGSNHHFWMLLQCFDSLFLSIMWHLVIDWYTSLSWIQIACPITMATTNAKASEMTYQKGI